MTLKNKILGQIIAIEGGYSNHKSDSGGETMFGITKAVAEENGYFGAMADLPLELAYKIYSAKYWDALNLDKICSISEQLAEELADTAINCGTYRAGTWLQRALNLLNRRSIDYPNIAVDANIGAQTISALNSYLWRRGRGAGLEVLLKTLNILQGAHYVSICEQKPDSKNEDFFFGWVKNRIDLPDDKHIVKSNN